MKFTGQGLKTSLNVQFLTYSFHFHFRSDMYPIKNHIWLRSDAKKQWYRADLFFKHVQQIPICASVNAALVPNWLKGTAMLKGIVLTKNSNVLSPNVAQTCVTSILEYQRCFVSIQWGPIFMDPKVLQMKDSWTGAELQI